MQKRRHGAGVLRETRKACRTANRDTHAVVTGEPGARKPRTPGSEGGRQEKGQQCCTSPDGLPCFVRRVMSGTPNR